MQNENLGGSGLPKHQAVFKPERGVQAEALLTMNAIRSNREARYLVLHRITCLFGIDREAVISKEDVRAALEVARSVFPNDALAWFKTATNAWCTSSRMHEPVRLDCVFGCRHDKDKLDHYLRCPILWSLITKVFGCLLPSQVCARLNYYQPSALKLCVVSAALDVYHAIKIGRRADLDDAFLNRRFGNICSAAKKVLHDYLITHSPVFLQRGGNTHAETDPTSSTAENVSLSPDAPNSIGSWNRTDAASSED